MSARNFSSAGRSENERLRTGPFGCAAFPGFVYWSAICPAGTAGAATLHLARATSRRAERTAVAAAQIVPLNPLALSYLNRLSDYLFVAARRVNKDAGGDVLWIPGASRDPAGP